MRIRKIKWRSYYYRVIGMFLLGGGLFLVADELFVQGAGPFKLSLIDHEFWGIVIAIVGCVLISKKSHGKDL